MSKQYQKIAKLGFNCAHKCRDPVKTVKNMMIENFAKDKQKIYKVNGQGKYGEKNEALNNRQLMFLFIPVK